MQEVSPDDLITPPDHPHITLDIRLASELCKANNLAYSDTDKAPQILHTALLKLKSNVALALPEGVLSIYDLPFTKGLLSSYIFPAISEYGGLSYTSGNPVPTSKILLETLNYRLGN